MRPDNHPIHRSMSRPRVQSLGCAALALILFAGLLAFGAADAHAQAVNLVDLKVSGQSVADVQLVRNISGLKPGSQIAQEDIQRAIHQVYGLGLFQSVRILGEEVDGGVILTIDVVEFPRLNQIRYDGLHDLKEKDFVLTLRRGQTVSPHRLRQAEQTIRSVYQGKGFYLVEIESDLVPTQVQGEADAVFRIKENNRVRVGDVDFEGLVNLAPGDLKKKMSNKRHGFLRGIFGSKKFDREAYAEDKMAIIDACRAKGFLDATIQADTIILNDERTEITQRFTINEGPRYYFGETAFKGTEVLSEERLARQMRYDPGDVYNQDKFQESIGRIYENYMEEGYLYARVVEDQKTTDSTVNITFEISEGVPAHVHRIDITGNTKTRDKVIRRELAIYPGQIFRRSALTRSMRNVMLLNYFGNVVPEFRQLPDGRVNLEFQVEEKPTGQIQVGGGYSEQDRLVGTIDLGIPNLFGRGQSANLLLEFGARRQSFRLGFTEPWFMDTPTTVGFDIQRLDRIWDDPFVSGEDDFTQRTNGFTLRLGRRLRWPDDYFTIFWNYRWEDQEFTDFSDDFDQAGRQSLIASANGVISSTSFTIQRDSRNLPEFATAGSRASYRIELGGGALGGDWTFTRHNLNYSFYKKLLGPFTLAPGWTLGIIDGGPSVSTVPYSELFYAGGIRSDGMIRGYSDRSIVAFEDTSQVAGNPWTLGEASRPDTTRGQAMLVMNAQITFPIVKQQIHGLFFFDAGNVWLNATHIEPFSNMYTSYGFGFRLAVPGMGTLGFDFGIPLRGRDEGKLKPHFQFGGAF